ncbi:MAG: DUF721 domain-containing protein [Bacteroidaceae bacterium]|nr:DUF721 domain-containing protein [Bacteroidaceae bacterium]
MFRRRETHINNPLNELLRKTGLETPLLQRRLIAAWPSVVGEYISSLTGEMFIKNQTLMVKLNSPALRQELSMHQTKLTEHLNNKVNAQIITRIRFY